MELGDDIDNLLGQLGDQEDAASDAKSPAGQSKGAANPPVWQRQDVEVKNPQQEPEQISNEAKISTQAAGVEQTPTNSMIRQPAAQMEEAGLTGMAVDFCKADESEGQKGQVDGPQHKESADSPARTVKIAAPTVAKRGTPGDGRQFARRSNNLFVARGRFRRRRATDVESEEDKKARFWAGVRPTRKNSVLGGRMAASGGTSPLTMATLRAAIKLKKRATFIHSQTVLDAYILDPRSQRMRYWKNWMLVNIMYTVLMVPGQISFNSEPGAFFLTLSAIANISFVVDTVLHFFTAVPLESGLITDRGHIIRRYLSTWFILDLITCLPVTTLLRHKIDPSFMALAPLRGVRLLSLLKVVKVYALHYEVSPVAMSIGKTLVTVILAAHLLSCLWYWVHCFDAADKGNPKSWEQCGHPGSTASQYLSSFYFIIYTMMTVGYGDQSADATSKKGLILSVGIQLTGATLFGFIIAATRRIVQFIAPIQKATTRNLQEISEYAVDRRLPDGVSSRIKRHFRYFYFKTSVFDERAVMRHVPWQLCHEVVAHTHAVALTATGLLQDRDFSPVVLMRLARSLKPMELDAGEEVVRQGDIVLQVYFVIRGRIEAYLLEAREDGRSPSTRGTESGLQRMSYLGVWGPGSLWGLNNILLGGYAEATFVGASPTELLWLDQLDLIPVMEEHPQMRSCLEKTAKISQDALREAVNSETIRKEGLNLQQISLTDFKASDLKQQLKHTDVHSLCSMAAADQASPGNRRRSIAGGGGGGRSSLAQDLRNIASIGGLGVKGGVRELGAALKRGLGKKVGGRVQQRLVRTWRAGTPGYYSQVHNWMGQAVKGVMETEETPEELNRRLIVLPDQPLKLRWDAGVSMVCVLVAIFTPYRMAFADHHSIAWLGFDAIVDILFVVDILLKCRTAYVGSAANNVIVYITVPGMIIRDYLQGSLIMDVASTVPFYLIRVTEKAFRGLFVLKLLRVGRVLSLADQLYRLSEQEAISNGGPRRRWRWLRGLNIEVPRWGLDFIQILLVIYYSAHIFGCLWWLTSRYQMEESWWVLDGLSLADSTSTYIASLYWGVTTITTVGYGDLVPRSDLERIVACVTMVCGTTMFSYVIGSVSSLVMAYNSHVKMRTMMSSYHKSVGCPLLPPDYYETFPFIFENPTGGQVRRKGELLNVNNYLEEKKVGEHLSRAVRGHMAFIMGARSAWNEDHILSRLPPPIRQRVLEHVHREAVDVIPILKARPPGFVSCILRQLRPQMYLQGEVVYKNVKMSQGVYFVIKGIAEAFKRTRKKEHMNGDAETEDKVKGIISVGNLFGYTRFLAAFLQDDLSIRACSQLQVYLLSNSSIRYFLHHHPFLAKELRTELEHAIFDHASEELMAEDRLQDAQRAPDADAKVDGGNSPRPNRPTSALTSYLRRASMAKAEGPAIEGDEARSQRATIKVTSQDRGDSEERLEGALSKCVASADDLESRSSAEVGSLAGLPISRQQDRTHSAVMGGSSRGDMQTGPVGPSHPMLDAAAAAVAVYVEEERRDAATNEQFGESGGHERLSFEGDQSKFEERADAQASSGEGGTEGEGSSAGTEGGLVHR